MPENVTVERVDRALAAMADETPVDDRALLWITRAALLGQPIRPAHLVVVMGLTEEEAEDVFARLAEHGLIDSDETL